MRPGQNKRLRGRNNRKGPNPLTRSYESNGPDVKVRGTAQHIAEKYLQLARDAQSSGDPVMAESYLQHAEHYYRLIAAAQAAQQAQMGLRPAGEAEIEEEEEEALPDRFASVAERLPQPQFPQGQSPQGQPYQDRPERQDRPGYDRQPRFEGERQPRQDRQDFERGDRPERPERQERQERQDRGERGYRQNFRDNRRFRDNRNEQPRFEGAEPRAAERPVADEPRAAAPEEPVGLPAFITAPVRATTPAEDAAPEPAPRDEQAEAGGYHLRPRRRRRRPAGEGDGAETGAPIAPEVE